jgi:hypothetical protein
MLRSKWIKDFSVLFGMFSLSLLLFTIFISFFYKTLFSNLNVVIFLGILFSVSMTFIMFMPSRQNNLKKCKDYFIYTIINTITLGSTFLFIKFKDLFPFLLRLKWIIFFIIGLIIIVEIIFFFEKDSTKLRKKDLFKYTCKKKLKNMWETILCVSFIGQLYFLVKYYNFLKIVMVIVAIIVFILLFYGWIKLNTLKFKCNVVEDEEFNRILRKKNVSKKIGNSSKKNKIKRVRTSSSIISRS